MILFAISNIREQDRDRILEICKQTGVRVVLVPNILKLMQRYLRQGTADDESGAFSRLRVDAGKVSTWLAELEELATTSDPAALAARIRQIRANLSEDLQP